MAGRHILDGLPLYTPDVAVNTLGACKYPPLFAQIVAPFSLMPELAFTWLWRAVCFLRLRPLVGSWRNVGLTLLFPPIWNELSDANVTFPVAYVGLLALRGRPALLPVGIALKFGPALLVPFILLRRGPEDRRRLINGTAFFAILCAVSILVAPAAWHDYLASMGQQASSSPAGPWVLSFAPSGAVDFAFRGSLAVVATLVAIAVNEERLAWAAAVVTVPLLFFTRLARLVALLAWRRSPATVVGRRPVGNPESRAIIPGLVEVPMRAG